MGDPFMMVRIPLLKDYHNHPYLYAALAACLDISAVTRKQDALSLIVERFASDDFVMVIGWYDSSFTFAPDELDHLPPLVVFNISLHAMFMNKAARERVAAHFPEVTDKYRKEGWLERNVPRVLGFILETKPCGADGLRSFYAGLARQGVWYAEEMTLQGEAEVEVFRESGLTGRSRFWAARDVFATMNERARLQVHGIKMFVDGAVGARTAMLDSRYLCGGEGLMIWRSDELRGHLQEVSDTGKALSIHAIGNVAIDLALLVLEGMSDRRCAFPEIRLEHCQFISLEAARKAKSMGVILCLQPNFSLDSTCYADRLPEPYRLRNNPFRMLIDQAGFIAGKDLLLGSDGMPHGARAALESALFPPLESQRLTLEEFVAGYCMEDFRHGHIDASIDHEGRSLETTVVLEAERDHVSPSHS